jgi:NCS1 family nucleobase:cation symporter-1
VNQSKNKTNLINWELVSVNPNDKKWDWKDIFCFWGVSIQSIIAFSLITSLYLVYDLNIAVVFFGSLIGSFLVYYLANLIGKPSQKYGLPFPVILRSSLGIYGAKYFALLRGIVGIFMFGTQTYFLSKAFSYLIRISLFSIDKSFLDQEIFLVFILGLNIIDWSSFIIAILLQSFLFSKSHKFNKLIINCSAITVYSGMLLFFFTVLLLDVKQVASAFADIFIFNNIFLIENITPLVAVAGTIFAYFSIIILNYGDFSRYVKDEKELKKGNISLFLNLIIFSFFAVFIVVGSDVIFHQKLENVGRILTSPMDIVGTLDNTFITVTALFFIFFASASTNLIANYVPAQNSLLNFFPSKLNLKSSSYIIVIFGFIIGIFWIPLLSQIGILSIVDTMSSFFGPLLGVMIIDYYLIKDSNLNNQDIFSSEPEGTYFYSKGWHIKSLYSIVIGFIFSASSIWNINLMFLKPYSWLIGFMISSLTYYLLASK